jgi:hypothetical protein
MASYTVQISQIQAASAYGSGLLGTPLSRWYRRFSVLYAFPKIVRFITDELTNERVQRLTVEQSKELYMPLVVLHREVGRALDWVNSKPLLLRILLRYWVKSLEGDAERIGDVAEALAWGSDSELRKAIDGSLSTIEQEHLNFS